MVILQPLIYDWFKFKNRWADKLWAVCSVSIAAQVVTFPLAAFYFHQFPVYFLISNLLIIIPAELILFAGVFYLALPQITFISAALGWILEKSILIMNKVLMIIEQAPFASIGKIWFTTAEYILAYGVIICLVYYLFNRKLTLLRLSLALMLVLAVSSSFKKFSSISSSDSIAFLNLRKHSGLVFKHGNKAIVLSDLADTDKNYRYSVQPYLDSSKVADISVYAINQNIRSPYLLKRDNVISFNNIKVLIYNKYLQNISLPHQLKVDYIYLTGNPHITIADLTNNYQFNTLIIDGNNNDRLIGDWEKQAANSGIKYYCLKRNNSFVALSD
jgi:Competence protein.